MRTIPRTGTVRAETVSIAVVDAIAEQEGVDPMDLDPPLYEVVDPDALDTLFSPDGNTAGRVAFSYNGYEINVTSGGEVRVSDSDGR